MPKMRYDHFENNPQQRGTSDFNFNINFGDMPQVAEMAATLGKMLKERERAAGLQLFHSPIPPKWLHLTEWYGSTKDFTQEEVLQAVGILRPMLASMQKLEAQLSTWWQAKEGRAVPMLDVTPKEPFQRIYAMVRSVMQDVVDTIKKIQTIMNGKSLKKSQLARSRYLNQLRRILVWLRRFAAAALLAALVFAVVCPL
jgi:hypothetical protein